MRARVCAGCGVDPRSDAAPPPASRAPPLTPPPPPLLTPLLTPPGRVRHHTTRAPGQVLLPVNEPTFGTPRKSQIQTYLEQNEGPGLQHMALKTGDIFHTLRWVGGGRVVPGQAGRAPAAGSSALPPSLRPAA